MKKKKKPKPKKFKFAFEIPDLTDYVGRRVTLQDGTEVVIETIVGNVGMSLGRRPEERKPMFAEINGKHLINFLRFFAQMNGAKDITEEQFLAYEDLQTYSEPVQEDEPIETKKAAASIIDAMMIKGKKNGTQSRPK